MAETDVSKKVAAHNYYVAWYAKNKAYLDAKRWVQGLSNDGLTAKQQLRLRKPLQTVEEKKARKQAYIQGAGRQVASACRKRMLAENPNLDRENYLKRADYYKAKAKQWRIDNPELAKAKDKASKEKRKVAVAVKAAEYKAKHKEKLKAQYAEWAKENVDKTRAYNANRRAMKAMADGRHTPEDILKIKTLQKWKCAVCKVDIKGACDIDHIKPLSKGGGNGPENLQALCPRCNRSKNAKDPIEFMQSRGFLI